ncbi:MAG: hypothetical protein HWN67_03655 [Candidatus Helarchaeota archaeon]|nr:hypothetical protein [Candidatus Helarchaeota archaeon]
MKIGIKYPEDKVLKVKTMRYLNRNNIEIDKITGLLSSISAEEINDLRSFGNEIVELGNESNSKQVDTFKNAFMELDKLFLNLASDPDSFDFESELMSINLETIDKAKENLKNE